MRKRYRTSIVMGAVEGHDPTGLRGTVPQGAHFLDMGDGTCVLMSAEEYARRTTPNEILAQEAQEEAAQPGPVSQSPAGDGFRGILAETYPQWRARERKAPTLIQALDKAIDDAMKRIADNAVRMPSEIPDGSEGVHAGEPTAMTYAPLVDPERASEREWSCEKCRTGGSAKDQIAADVALHDHRESPEHDRAIEKSLRRDVENARTALYDYLKSKGRVA